MNKLPNLKFGHDIIWDAGAVLSIGLTVDNVPLFRIFHDYDEATEAYTIVYVFMRDEDFLPFVNGIKSYHETIFDSDLISIVTYTKGEVSSTEIGSVEFFLDYDPVNYSDMGMQLVPLRKELTEFLMENPSYLR